MTKSEWLPLNDFSTKHKISLSTLRRRIRAGEVEHRFQNGKYWLLDQPVSKYIRSYEIEEIEPVTQVVSPIVAEKVSAVTNSQNITNELVNKPAQPENGFMNSANSLMQELKNAYVSVLHEKENQIMQLKEEVTNLKTLVKILESENDRLTSNMKESAPIDTWLDKNFE